MAVMYVVMVVLKLEVRVAMTVSSALARLRKLSALD